MTAKITPATTFFTGNDVIESDIFVRLACRGYKITGALDQAWLLLISISDDVKY